ncbi:hypothetical protein [Acidovorax sp. MR-S7]|uniref:hypothetical protein n=1 Tax=Acidovorax sp. MR-S7 TaxID=1268622 RepID=UPI0003797DC7|nr:hypothetical protein [Acidovorax sp. MR-S7]
MSFIEVLFTAFAAVFLGALLGWAAAHESVARECDRLGGFYVGAATYKCAKDGKP